MTTYVMRRGRLVERSSVQHVAGGPSVISDEMPATRHMADGRHYTSKAKFRQATRAAGCVEVGNETKTLLAPRPIVKMSREQRRNDIRTAIRQLQGR